MALAQISLKTTTCVTVLSTMEGEIALKRLFHVTPVHVLMVVCVQIFIASNLQRLIVHVWVTILVKDVSKISVSLKQVWLEVIQLYSRF